MKIYTRTGDDGSTGLLGAGRVLKSSPRVEAYGAVDELNAHLGLVLALEPAAELAAPLRSIQNDLFHMGAELATPAGDEAPRPGPRIEARHVAALEALMQPWIAELGPLAEFILPGGTPAAAALHVARTVCRRAERLAVAFSRLEEVSPQTLQYLNRLSDLLFVMARLENRRRGRPETYWDSHA